MFDHHTPYPQPAKEPECAVVVALRSYNPEFEEDLTPEEKQQQLNDFLDYAIEHPKSGCSDAVIDCAIDAWETLVPLINIPIPEGVTAENVETLSRFQQTQMLKALIPFVAQVRHNLMDGHDLNYRD